MEKRFIYIVFSLLLTFIASAAICGTLARINIIPEDIGLIAGAKQQFKVVGEDADGIEVTVPTPITWTASSSAGLISNGLFTGGNTAGKYWGAILVSVPGGFTAAANVEILPKQPQGGYCLERSLGSLNAGAIDSPSDIVLDTAGNLYVLSQMNCSINKLDSSGHYVSSINLKNNNFTYNAFARDARDGSFYLLDNSRCVVEKYSALGTFILQWGSGGTAAGQFNWPRDIAVDSNGRVLVADTYNFRVQVFNSQGQFLAQWIPVDDDYLRPGCLTVDSSNNIWVVDSWSSTVQKFNSQGTLILTIHPDGDNSSGIALNPTGGFYSVGGGSIYKVDASGNVTIAWGSFGIEPGMFDVTGEDSRIALDGSGRVYVSDYGNSRIHVYSPEGQLLSTWASAGNRVGQLKYPSGAAVDSIGNLYIADTDNCRVLQYNTDFTFQRELASKQRGDSVFAGPSGLAIDNQGNVLISDGRCDRVLGYSTSGSLLKNWSLPPNYLNGDTTTNVGSPCGIAQDSSGNTYVTDPFANKVYKLDHNGALVFFWGSYGSAFGQFGSPIGSGILPNGNILISDAGNISNNRIQRFDSSGNYLGQWGATGSGQGQFSVPAGLSVDSVGNTFVADSQNNRIQKFDTSGNYIAQIGSKGFGVNQFFWPTAVTVDGLGNLYISDTNNHRMLKYAPYNPKPSFSISAPSLATASTGQITYTISYTDATTVTLTAANITLNKTGTANGSVSVSGTGALTRTVTVSGITGDGTLGISIAAGSASNSVGVAPSAGPSATVAVDNTPPSVTLSAPSASSTNSDPITYTATYAGANSVSLTASNVTLNKTGTASGSVTVTGTGTTSRTIKISSITGDGTLGISIAAGTASDNTGNVAAAVGPSTSFAVVNTAPAISISAPSRSATSAGPVTYSVTYTGAASVTLSAADVTLNKTGSANGTIAVSGTDNTTRTITLSDITGDGTIGISLASGTASNVAGSAPFAGPSAVFIADNTPPTINISTPSASIAKSGPITYAITYGGANSVSLLAKNVTLNKTGTANGSVSVTGTGTTTRTVRISSITGDGTLGISIVQGTALDSSGNSASAVGPSATFTIDNTTPTINIGDPSAPLTAVGPITYSVTYEGADNISLLPSSITLNKTGTANGTLSVSDAGATVRDVTISNITGDGTLGISILAGTASDNAGNTAPTSGPSTSFTVVNTLPVLTISAPSESLTNGGPITYAVTYDGADSIDLELDNITLNKTGTASGTLAVTGTGSKTRNVTISDIVGNGTLGISIDANTASNYAGSALSAGPSTVFFVDNISPTITIGDPSLPLTNDGPISYTITYVGADSINLQLDDITLNRTGTANGTLTLSGTGNTTRTVRISNTTGDGALGISIAQGTASDNAGNTDASTTGSSTTFVVDNTPPTLKISAPSTSTTNVGPIAYTITYIGADHINLLNENVGLIKSGTANGTLIVSGSGNNTRTVTISNLTGDGTLGISVAQNTASDDAGNTASAVGTSPSFKVVNTPPIISISAPSSSSTNVGPVTYTINYSGADVINLTNENITLNKTGTPAGTISVTGIGLTIRKVTISNITGSGRLGISIAAATASNFGGSATVAGPSNTFAVTNATPTLGSVNPNSGSVTIGNWITFTTSYSDADGTSDLSTCSLLINNIVANSGGLHVFYDRVTNKLYMKNNAGTIIGGVTKGTVGTIQSENGILDTAGTTVVANGNTLTISWRVQFKSTMSTKACNIYLSALDISGLTSGWTDKGDIKPVVNLAPTLGTVTPNSGSAFIGKWITFTASYSDSNGSSDLSTCSLLINNIVANAGGLHVFYDRVTNKLYMKNNAGAIIGGVTKGTVGTIQSENGILDTAATTVTASGNTLTINWRVQFKSTMAAKACNIYLTALDASGLTSGWIDKGDITPVLNVAPTLGNVIPNSGSAFIGKWVTFTASYSDSNGQSDLSTCNMIINNTVSNAGGLHVFYDRVANKFYIKNNAGTILGGVINGTVGTIQAENGILDTAGTTVTASGNTITINWRVQFKSTMTAKSCNIYLTAMDLSGLTCGWIDKGDITLVANVANTLGKITANSEIVTLSEYASVCHSLIR